MSDGELVALAGDPGTRRRHYDRLVPSYFDRVTDVYRESWDDSFHFLATA